MSDRLSDIEARLQQIEETLYALKTGEAPARLLASAGADAPSRALAPGPARLDAVAVLTLVGRTLMVLGGAYLLRALTEAGRLPGHGGVLLGLAYAATWFGAADRAGATRKLSGIFHGLAAILIGLPLLWEASTHFAFFSPETSAAALAGLTGLALAVAWHRDLQILAGVATLGSLAAAGVLVAATGRPLPFAAGLIVLGAATSWLGDRCRWFWLPWPPALAATLLFAGLITRASATPPLDRPAFVLVLQLLLLAAYAGPAAWRTIVRGARVRPFEIVQVVVVLALGLGGAIIVADDRIAGIRVALGALALLSASGCYAVALGPARSRHGQEATANFYLALAVGFTLTGGAVLLTTAWLVVFLGVLALSAMGVGAVTSQPALSLHGAIFSVAAAWASGLLTLTGTVWLTTGPFGAITPLHGVGLIIAVASLALPRAASGPVQSRSRSWLTVAPRLLLGVVAAASLGAFSILLVGPLVAADPLNPGILASTKTVTLAATALVAAIAARVNRWVECRWLVLPILVAGGVKLVVDDFRHSSPATLFLALAVYGAALIVAPRITPRGPVR